ncbi:23S rRNA (guanosine(2251)-2'-O)-methyltransferase RlmB [Lachnoclostridium sp. An131]|jgi:23S rRNA (guanosine2251-2'-O)-methyltransferase|uniref:23S rRNA (guanosine(2251)-2'-O)-methyltransferase RlmB n=1 Tax=Lachnoclostridium sp. An131 TaxID=1965555 RepID=UPI000B378F30|nr:23S rRNA (guanosine(2251)-2'-O)-methyltransferase RlmB [Lachnoclostridium sp. An131]OUQ27745.1 23S rRNA (guanosine(2251)-2'-O)-methyltransferase RlmB [Lachnoclostridium sp. An131]
MRYKEQTIEGRNAVLEAFRSGKTIDKLYILDGCQDGSINSIKREARKNDTIINFVTKERLDQLSSTGRHQGVIAQAAAYAYASVEEMLENAREKGEDPFLILLDDIEDPHNLGAIIRTANLAGAHGVIIPKRRAAGLTAVVARASAGAINYTPVAKVTNLTNTIRELKEKGLWFVCADMGGELMYDLNLTGPVGLVIGNEGEGVSRLVREACDFTASIPMKGNIDSLNASVAAGVLSYEIVRQRMVRQGTDV